jgi:hypothetical protein
LNLIAVYSTVSTQRSLFCTACLAKNSTAVAENELLCDVTLFQVPTPRRPVLFLTVLLLILAPYSNFSSFYIP